MRKKLHDCKSEGTIKNTCVNIIYIFWLGI